MVAAARGESGASEREEEEEQEEEDEGGEEEEEEREEEREETETMEERPARCCTRNMRKPSIFCRCRGQGRAGQGGAGRRAL